MKCNYCSVRFFLWLGVPLLAALNTPAVTFTNDTSISAGDTNYEGQDIEVTNCTLTIDGPHIFNSFHLFAGGVMTHSVGLYGLSLSVSNDFQIEAEAAIDLSGQGYGPGAGPGAGSTALTNYPYYFYAGSGAGHGGFGGASADSAKGGNCYDALLTPRLLGSGGGAGFGAGGFGGGALLLFVGGTLRVDGEVLANGTSGTNGNSGGGSGGSLWLNTQTLSGGGAIAANGGDGELLDGGGGGGGQVAIYYASNQFAGSISAYGGVGYDSGGAGTIFLRASNAPTSQVIIDNAGVAGTNTLFTVSGAYDVLANGGAIVQPLSTSSLNSLMLSSNSWFTTVQTEGLSGISLTVTSNAVVDSASGFNLDGEGYPAGTGPGAGQTLFSSGSAVTTGGGAGHGGFGGASAFAAAGGASYDSLFLPSQSGSGGGNGTANSPANVGGAGGGLLRLTVGGNLVLNGRLSANGRSGVGPGSGGGAGGSIMVSVGSLSGAGQITANGGGAEPPYGGGGAGGRIAINYVSSQFAGTFAAHGAAGAVNGGAGTVYVSVRSAIPQVTVDNGGLNRPLGTNATPVTAADAAVSFDLSVTGGATASLLSQLSIHNLLIGSNSWLSAASGVAPQNGSPLSVNVATATVQAGGGIFFDAQGYAAANGPGAGHIGQLLYGGVAASGGGYGGPGGNSVSNVLGGGTYGSVPTPNNPGSGGGNGSGNLSNNLGGAGGGALQMNVSGTLTLNGQISANGGSSFAEGGGGGAGGSVWLTVGNLTGTGAISANGGSGDLNSGGGGGGGRIALYYTNNFFTGSIAARGGPGVFFGSAGTIYLKSATNTYAQIVFDNGGITATNSPLSVSGPIDLTIQGGSIVSVANPPDFTSIGNLFIASNSFLVYTSALNQSAQLFNLTINNATIQSGAGLLLDGAGYGAGLGTGAGRSVIGGVSEAFGLSGGGGGHGGAGGSSFFGASGGGEYDTYPRPNTAGSGGGNGLGNQPYNLGGSGGGALNLTVNGALTLDGRLSANGTTGPGQASGGGSGGSLYLSVTRLLGSGVILANGGAGDLPYGGGGGGGRIAIAYRTNLFTGTIAARGGAGAVYGGAGTIYLTPSQPIILPPFISSAQLIVDNGGFPGASNTFVILTDARDLTVTGAASVSLAPSAAVPGLPTLRNVLIDTNSSLTFAPPSQTQTQISFTVTSLAIQSGGRFTFDGLGYAGGLGPGRGLTLQSNGTTTGGGGAYAGYGGSSLLGALGGVGYGNAIAPTDSGSGGGNTLGQNVAGGTGGGSLKLTVSGILTNNGLVSANGTSGAAPGSGGGSGGALWLTVGNLTGSGIFSANGGAGDPPYGGGGGGGRIAITYTTNQFAGTIVARGAPGAVYGGAGTVYLSRSGNSIPQVTVDNGGITGTNTLLSQVGFCDLTLSGGAIANFSAGNIHSLLINSNASLSGLLTYPSQLFLEVQGNAVIQPGGAISLDRLGWPGNNGPGAGRNSFSSAYGNTGGGGGYGGAGGSSISGAIGGAANGSIMQPTSSGSGGGQAPGPIPVGGSGGGALQLVVNSNLVINGRISAEGAPFGSEGSGGGAGGSVWLTAATISGSGTIAADGGSGDPGQGGGGGGGRIALNFGSNQFAGSLSAHGGTGAVAGGAGTIYLQADSLAPQVLIDNAGLAGTNTPVAGLTNYNLQVLNNSAVYTTDPGLVLKGLLVDSGGILTHLATQSNIDLTVLGDAMIGTNGAIDVDLKGYQGPYGGPGVGQMTNTVSGSGAGYGGVGGAGISGIAGGSTYGSAQQPTQPGSRGGIYPVLPGFCEGGGAVRLRVAGTLTLNGMLSANGDAALIEGAGGGSGGSIWVTTRNLQGAGYVFANGGPGEPTQGGGGGGGRIAIYCRTNSFTGIIGAYGGGGASPGGNGSIIFSTNIPAPQVIAQTPSDIVSYAVSTVDFTFDGPMDATSMAAAIVPIDTPNGLLDQNTIATSVTGLNSMRVTFPSQTTLGFYQLELGSPVMDIYGDTMDPYYGSFIILSPLISGQVVDTNGVGVPYVTLHVSGDSVPTVSDAHGNYSIEVYPSWAGTITPARGTAIFIPPSRTYTNVSNDLTNQNFVMATTPALTLAIQPQASGGCTVACYGLNGVSYQLLYSSDLVNWAPYGGPAVGTNGPMCFQVPPDGSPAKFFRFTTSY